MKSPTRMFFVTLIVVMMALTTLSLKPQGPPILRSMQRCLSPVFLGAACLSSALLVSIASPVSAANLENGSALFASSCSGCHAGGSNLFSGSKTLFMKDLVKNKYDTSEAMESLISKGRGQMPAYGSFISPKGNVMPAKYSAAEIKDITDYVLDQASSNWVVTK
jgi:cytochrome c6